MRRRGCGGSFTRTSEIHVSRRPVTFTRFHQETQQHQRPRVLVCACHHHRRQGFNSAAGEPEGGREGEQRIEEGGRGRNGCRTTGRADAGAAQQQQRRHQEGKHTWLHNLSTQERQWISRSFRIQWGKGKEMGGSLLLESRKGEEGRRTLRSPFALLFLARSLSFSLSLVLSQE